MLNHLVNLTTRTLLLFSISIPLMLAGQPANVDSLEQILSTPVVDTTKLSVLSELFQHYYDHDLDKGYDCAKQMITLAEEVEVNRFRCMGYRNLGDAQRKMNHSLDTVLLSLNTALQCSKEEGNLTMQAKILVSIGGAYHRRSHHAEAMDYYNQALTISEQEKDTLSTIAGLANIASILKRRLDFNKSLQYSRQALELAKAVEHDSYIGMITNNIANIYFNQQSYDTALVLYEEALAMKRKEGAFSSLAITLANIGGIHVEEGRYELAHQYLDESYTLSLDKQYPYGQILSLRYMTSAALRQDDYQKAIRLSREGLQRLGPESVHQYARDFHWALSQAFEGLNRLDSAIAHIRAYQSIHDTLFQTEKEKQIQQLEIDCQIRQKEVENQLLKAEQDVIAQKLTNRNFTALGLILALVLAGGWGLSLRRNNRERKRMNEQLEVEVAERTNDYQIANEQLKQANYELKSFNYIASHDLKEPIRNVGNYVGLISRKLPADVKEELKDYFGIIHQSTSQLYTLIEDIASYTQVSKDDSSLRSEIDLNSMVSDIKLGLQPVLDEKGGSIRNGELPTLCSSLSLLFVVLKNLIENGLKFNESSAPLVEVKYQSTPTHHQITVTDNGIGIEDKYQEQIFTMFKRLHNMGEYPGSGIGLAMVKLAVDKLGGEITLESELGVGSSFLVELPKDPS